MTGNGSVINTLEWLHSCTVNNQSRLEKGKKRRRKETAKLLNLSTKHSPFENKPKFKVCISASSELFKNCHNVCVFQQFSESHTTEIPIFAEYCKNGCRSRSFWDHCQNSERWDPTTPNLLEFDPQHFEKFNTDRRRNSKHIVKSFNHKNYIQTCMADCTTSYNLRTRPQQLVTTTFLITHTHTPV